jgi:hypothetical protein
MLYYAALRGPMLCPRCSKVMLEYFVEPDAVEGKDVPCGRCDHCVYSYYGFPWRHEYRSDEYDTAWRDAGRPATAEERALWLEQWGIDHPGEEPPKEMRFLVYGDPRDGEAEPPNVAIHGTASIDVCLAGGCWEDRLRAWAQNREPGLPTGVRYRIPMRCPQCERVVAHECWSASILERASCPCGYRYDRNDDPGYKGRPAFAKARRPRSREEFDAWLAEWRAHNPAAADLAGAPWVWPLPWDYDRRPRYVEDKRLRTISYTEHPEAKYTGLSIDVRLRRGNDRHVVLGSAEETTEGTWVAVPYPWDDGIQEFMLSAGDAVQLIRNTRDLVIRRWLESQDRLKEIGDDLDALVAAADAGNIPAMSRLVDLARAAGVPDEVGKKFRQHEL